MITLQVAGTGTDTTLRLEDFLRQLEAVKKALRETQRVLTRGKGPDVHYRVVGISRSSPYRIQLKADAPPSSASHVATLERTFPAAAEEIQYRGKSPRGFDGPALRAYQEMASELEQKITPMVIETEAEGTEEAIRGEVRSVSVDGQLAKRVGVLLGPKQYAFGSVTGRLEQVNIHSGQNVFTVYPAVGPPRGVRCRFHRELLGRVTEGVDRYVEVTGLLTYNEVDYFPEEIRVQSIEVYPAEHSFPSVERLRGIAPDATGDKSPEQFIRDLRDEEE